MSHGDSRPARLAGSTARVSRRWPRVPFWLQRGSVRESGAALPGAAVSATAAIALLVYEPGQDWPIFRAVAPDILTHPFWLAVLSLVAPIATSMVLRSRRRPGAGRWLALLPVYGLVAVARAVTGADAAARERGPRLPLPAANLQQSSGVRLPWPALAAWGPYRASFPWQILLFVSHLGWLCGAAALLANGDPQSRVAGFGALHLLAMAGAQLMMEHEQRRRALQPFGWANRAAPCLLLLPAPAHLLAVVFWMLPGARRGPSSLAAFAFSAQGPLQRLAVFRTPLPARSGLSTFFDSWTAGAPFAHLAAARRRREQPWIALHLFAFALQSMAAVRFLLPLGGPTAEALLLRMLGLAAVLVAALYVFQLALVLVGFRPDTSPLPTGLGRSAGFLTALTLGRLRAFKTGLPPEIGLENFAAVHFPARNRLARRFFVFNPCTNPF